MWRSTVPKKAQKYVGGSAPPPQSINIPSTNPTSEVTGGELCPMRFLSFTHIWIALGAFVTTTFSWLWCVDGFPMERGSMWIAMWVGLSTGLGYTVQRAIKHTRHPHNMPGLRRAFWDRWKWGMIACWTGAWLAFNVAYVEELGWEEPGRLAVVAGVGLASVAYALMPGMGGGLRKVTWLKIPLIAVVWATATTHHPVLGIDPVLWVQRVMFIAGLTLPFDIRDLDVDRAHMTTLPMVVTAERVLTWARLLLGAAAALSFGVWLGRLLGHGLRPIDVGPAVLAAQSFWAWWMLRPAHALPALQGPQHEREHYTGWRLDGVLVMPCLGLLALCLVLLFWPL